VQWRAKLQALLARAKCNLIRFSESFPDAKSLLAECARLGLEGIVARSCCPLRAQLRSSTTKQRTCGKAAGSRHFSVAVNRRCLS
jgi:hypothetical protein